MTFAVVVGAGTLSSTSEKAQRFEHRWTAGGVTVEADFTGAHLLHLSAAGCVLNDLYREAAALGLALDGVRVTADGAFDTDTWRSTGITYVVELDALGVDPARLDALLRQVDDVAEIPRAIRAGTTVERGDTLPDG